MSTVRGRMSAPVKRSVPFTLCLQALFGGAIPQFGWIFFGFGFIFFRVFSMQSEAFTWWKFAGPLETAQGTVVNSYKTGSEENDAHIYAITFSFTPDGETTSVSNTSYQLGDGIPEGTVVTVEYKAGQPHISRIQGLRDAEFGWLAIIAGIFPLFGLCCFVPGLVRGLNAIAMMRYGVPVVGTLESVDTTNTRVNHRPVFRVTFRFISPDGISRTVSFGTTNPEQAWMDPRPRKEQAPDSDTEEINPDALSPWQEIILYNPHNPAFAFVPAELGASIRVDAQGNIYGDNPFAGVAAMIIPALTIIGHGVTMLRQLLH